MSRLEQIRVLTQLGMHLHHQLQDGRLEAWAATWSEYNRRFDELQTSAEGDPLTLPERHALRDVFQIHAATEQLVASQAEETRAIMRRLAGAQGIGAYAPIAGHNRAPRYLDSTA